MSKTDLPILEQRRIEASVIKPIFEEMVQELGLEKASDILGKAIRKDARAQGKSYAESQDEPTSLMGFHSLLPQWTAGGALEMDILKEEAAEVEFNVTRCRYAEMYKEMGLGHIGHLLSCGRDGTFCEGYDSRIKLARTQTIMQGASHCDFRFTESSDKPDSD